MLTNPALISDKKYHQEFSSSARTGDPNPGPSVLSEFIARLRLLLEQNYDAEGVTEQLLSKITGAPICGESKAEPTPPIGYETRLSALLDCLQGQVQGRESQNERLGSFL